MAADCRGLSFSRRRFVQGASVAGLGVLTCCTPLFARPQPARTPKVGFLGNGSPPASSAEPAGARLNGLRQGLAERGYAEGRNLVIEARYADGRSERLPALAAELVAQPVDVLVGHAAIVWG